MAEIRLDKLLSDAAGLTRSASREAIKNGRVKLDGRTVLSGDIKVQESSRLTLDGSPLEAPGPMYIMMNKPAGLISATEDAEQETIIGLLPANLCRRELFPVGRLDKDATGLIIITDDGDYAHRVAHPKRCIPKLYDINTAEPMTAEDEAAFAFGLTLSDKTNCLPARLKVDKADPKRSLVEVFEGKYHQVKRMVASRGNAVLSIHRVSIGALLLDENLSSGEYRIMTAEEAASVFEM